MDGSPTQTAMVESSGGQSQIAQLSTTRRSRARSALPDQASAIPATLRVGRHCVFSLLSSLVDVRGLRERFGSESPGEYASGRCLLRLVVVLVGVEEGILFGYGAVAAPDRAAQLSSPHWSSGGEQRGISGRMTLRPFPAQ